MVFSFVQQPASTYLEFQRFKYPGPHGPVDAVAVPSDVHDHLLSAYTFLSSLIILKLWGIAIAVWVYFFYAKGHRQVNDLSMSVFNKRGSPEESFTDRAFYSPTKPTWRFYVLCFAILSVWVANIGAGILVPRTLILGNAAPVNPMSIYVPDLDYDSNDRAHLSASYALDVPLTLRAAGSALIASASLQEQILVSQPISLGPIVNNGNTEQIQQIQYSYNVSGADFGLQYYPNLLLQVTGACTTDYSWWEKSLSAINDPAVDYYYLWNDSSNVEEVSLDDGLQPLGIFFVDNPDTSSPTNFTWGAVVSSFGRGSFTPSTDPWYYTQETGQNKSDPTTTPYNVSRGRPALSCWENDEWTYMGQSNNVSNLHAIPGLGLSSVTQSILYRYFFEPKIVSVAQRLRPSNLQSATTSLGTVFDAGSSSLHSDLERLILAAYVATTNTFTDTTLYPASGQSSANVGGVTIPNIVLDNFARPSPGVGEFVVYSADITTLSVKVLILVPTFAVLLWLGALILLKATPIRITNAMEVSSIFHSVKSRFPNATICEDREDWNM